MLLDGQRFFGDVVLDSFNRAYRDDDCSLDQKYEDLKILNLEVNEENAYLKKCST